MISQKFKGKSCKNESHRRSLIAQLPADSETKQYMQGMQVPDRKAKTQLEVASIVTMPFYSRELTLPRGGSLWFDARACSLPRSSAEHQACLGKRRRATWVLGHLYPCWRPGWSPWLLALDWPSPGCKGHLGSEPVMRDLFADMTCHVAASICFCELGINYVVSESEWQSWQEALIYGLQ